MTATTDAPRWILGSGPDRDLAVPSGVDAPPAVRAASDAFLAALERYGAVGRTARDARLALKAAPLDDDAVTEANAAEVELEAARLETRRTAIELANSVHAAKPGWLVDAQSRAQTTANSAGNLLLKLGGVLDQLAAERDVIEALKSWPEQGSLVTQRWVLEARGPERRDAAVEALRHADAGGMSNIGRVCQRTPDELVAALTVEISGPVEPPPPARRMIW